MKKVLFLIAAALMIVCSGCVKAPETDEIRVIATIEPVQYIAEQILKDLGGASSLLSQNQDVHSFELKPLSMKNVANADIIIFLGSNLEFEEKNIQALTENARNTVVLFLSDGIDSVFDPHIWVSLKNLKILAGRICECISHYDEENRDYYENNFAVYSAKIDSADKILSGAFLKRNIKRIFTDHTAFSYLAIDYSVEQTAIFEESKEPSMKDISYTADMMKNDPDKILILTNPSSKRYADIFQREAGAKVIMFNPLSLDIVGEFLNLAASINNE